MTIYEVLILWLRAILIKLQLYLTRMRMLYLALTLENCPSAH